MPFLHLAELIGPAPAYRSRVYAIYGGGELQDIKERFCRAFRLNEGSYQKRLRDEYPIPGRDTVWDLYDRGLRIVGEWAWPIELQCLNMRLGG